MGLGAKGLGSVSSFGTDTSLTKDTSVLCLDFLICKLGLAIFTQPYKMLCTLQRKTPIKAMAAVSVLFFFFKQRQNIRSNKHPSVSIKWSCLLATHLD